MAKRKRNEVDSKKLQVTVDSLTESVLIKMVPFGIHGPNKAAVAAWIIRTWIWENHKDLRENGINIKPVQK